MTTKLGRAFLRKGARAAIRRDAEQPTGPEVRLLDGLDEFEDAVRVLCEAFKTDSHEDLINTSLLVAWRMSGNYVTGVYLNGEMVGAAVGWRGAGNFLHSHIAGVHPKHQSLGLGYLLKMHERKWAHEQGVRTIEWTFDPLVRRNAHFNICKLDARVWSYHEKLYGSLQDGLNEGDDTDRLLVRWDVTAAAPTPPRLSKSAADWAGPVVVEPSAWDFEAAPNATVASSDGSIRLVVTPHDIEGLRLLDPATAVCWREAVRLGLKSALDEGFEIADFTSDGCYVLRQPPLVRRSLAAVSRMSSLRGRG